MSKSNQYNLENAREYALTVFKTCKEVVAVNLVWKGFDNLPFSGYAVEAAFVDGTVGRLMARRGPFSLPLFVHYNPGDFDENCLWMHVVEYYLWKEDGEDLYFLGEIGFLRLSGDTFKFVEVPNNLASRSLDELKIELDLRGV